MLPPESTPIDAITCDQYVAKYLDGQLESGQIENILELWYHQPQDFICPDISSFTVQGTQAVAMGTQFRLAVSLSDYMVTVYNQSEFGEAYVN